MVVGLGCSVTKIGLQGRCFPVNFLKIYMLPFLARITNVPHHIETSQLILQVKTCSK